MHETSLADRLIGAFDTDTVVVAREADLPTDMEAAERIADAVAAAVGPIGGFKLGATIPAVRGALGLPRAFFGAVPAARIFPDGADVPPHVARQRGVECEYAFRFGRDLANDDLLDEAALLRAVDAVHPAIEIPGTRFERLGGYGGLALVADAGAVGALVLGPAMPLRDAARFTDAPVTLAVEGEAPVVGSGAVIEGGPLGPLLGFVRSAHARGFGLRRDQVVATGSCTGYVTVEPGRRISVRLDALNATVTMRFAEPPP